jgi:hypothetical protein
LDTNQTQEVIVKALHIKTTGQVKVVSFENDTCYKTLSDGVGGLIECVALSERMDLWCNEEGKNTGLPLNQLATRLFQEAHGRIDYIAGDAVITGGIDDDGNSLGLTDEQIHEVTSYLVLTS